jgi:hypothetical protein
MLFIFGQRTQGQQCRCPDCAEKAGKSPDNLKVDADHRNAQQEEGCSARDWERSGLLEENPQSGCTEICASLKGPL